MHCVPHWLLPACCALGLAGSLAASPGARETARRAPRRPTRRAIEAPRRRRGHRAGARRRALEGCTEGAGPPDRGAGGAAGAGVGDAGGSPDTRGGIRAGRTLDGAASRAAGPPGRRGAHHGEHAVPRRPAHAAPSAGPGEGLLAHGDPYGAHVAFRQLLSRKDARPEPALVAEAAANAAVARDFASALSWSGDLDAATLTDEQQRRWLHLARLKAGQALGRHDLALAAVNALTRCCPDTVRLDGQALLASARAHEALGMLERAASDYEVFANVHAANAEQAEALLALSRLGVRMGQTARARRTLSWLIEQHPQSASAQHARLDLLELDDRAGARVPAPVPGAALSTAEGYLATMRSAGDMAQGKLSCERFAARFIGADRPAELATALARLAGEGGSEIASITAKKCLADHLHTLLNLLAVAGDRVQVAALAAQAEALGLDVPATSRSRVDEARRQLGLEPHRGLLGQAVDRSREAARAGDWNGVVRLLRQFDLHRPRPRARHAGRGAAPADRGAMAHGSDARGARGPRKGTGRDAITGRTARAARAACGHPVRRRWPGRRLRGVSPCGGARRQPLGHDLLARCAG